MTSEALEAELVASTLSVYFKMSTPYAPSTARAEIHQRLVVRQRTPVRNTTPSTSRPEISRVTKTEYGRKSSGATPTYTIELALIPLTDATTKIGRASCRERV